MGNRLQTGRPKVVVIGAGMVGAFAAYFLARVGVDVVIVERDKVGGHASGMNAGGLNPLHGPGIPGPMMDLALASFRLHRHHWADLVALSGHDFRGGPVDRIYLTIDEVDARRHAELAHLHTATPGFSARWLSQAELRDVIPGITPDAQGGLHTAGNLRVDPEKYTRSVVDAALHFGAILRIAEASSLVSLGRRVTGVVVENGVVACDALVVASGPWCGGPSQWLNVNLPVIPMKGELLQVDMASPWPDVDLTWRNVGVYASNGRRAWVGGTEEQSGFDDDPSEAGRREILAGIDRVLPGCPPPQVLDHVAGLRPMTRDGLPIVGAPDRWDNVAVASGGGRKGMLLGAGLGRAAADLVTLGETSLPIHCCRIDRPELLK